MENSKSADPEDRSSVRPIGFRPAEISGLFNIAVIEQHASEAAFLWAQRERAAQAPHYKLKHLAKLDERAHAHLHGLRIAGHVGWRTVVAALEQGGPGTVFVASYLAFASGDMANMRHALSLASSQPAFVPALESALVWLELNDVRSAIGLLQKSPVAEHSRLALRVLAGHGVDPGEFLRDALGHDDVRLRATALQVTGQFKRRDLTVAVRLHLGDSDPTCRFWAGWALALLGYPEGPPAILEGALGQSGHESGAVEIAMRFGNWEWARQTVRALAARPAALRLAIQASGAFGDPAVIPWLLQQMQQQKYARVAAEAFSTITGADLDYLGLKQDAPEGELAETEVADKDLPWPDIQRVADWWSTQHDRCVPGQRYLAGRPISASTSVEVLRDGYQRQRRAAAIELARLTESAPLFSVVNRADRQLNRLAT